MDDFNCVRRVSRTGGLIGFSMSQKGEVEREVQALNRDGYRVSFITPESGSFLRSLIAFVILICTLGFWTKSPDLLVIGERMTHSMSSVRPNGKHAVVSGSAAVATTSGVSDVPGGIPR